MRTIRIIALVTLALIGFGPATPQRADGEVKLRYGTIGRSGLNWPNYIMIDKGFLAEEGIAIEFIVAGSSSRTMQYLVGGSIDIADGGPDAAILAIQKGATLRFIAANTWVPPFRLVAVPTIQKVEDLRGKKIGASALKTGEVVMTKKILKAHGLGEGDYEIVLIGGTPDRYAALTKGAIDATTLSQPFDFRAAAAGFRGFEYVSDVVSDYQFQVTVVDQRWAVGHRDLLVGYLRAKIRAHRWLWDRANRDEAIKILVKNTRLNEADATKTYDLWIGQQKPIVPRQGEVNLKGLQHVIEDMADAGLVQTPLPDPSRFVDTSLFEAALRSLGGGGR